MSSKSKVCSNCHSSLPLIAFYFKSSDPKDDRRHSVCKECDNDTRRSNHLKNKYGVSEEDYSEMLSEQEGVCAVCEVGTESTLHVDHNHTTGEVRGLLCVNCNTGLGKLQDDPKVLAKAMTYLLERGHYG